jgi:6-pyruvoyltetrahydropterin/6-carboxytetrahydropterin synthase
MEIYQDFTIEAGHRLPLVPAGHGCGRPHGHSFRIRICLEGPVDPATGWVLDFAEIAAAFEPLRVQLDHADLNGVPGLENPTSENLAIWIWERLSPRLAGLARIEVAETAASGCVYRGAGTQR